MLVMMFVLVMMLVSAVLTMLMFVCVLMCVCHCFFFLFVFLRAKVRTSSCNLVAKYVLDILILTAELRKKSPYSDEYGEIYRLFQFQFCLCLINIHL